MWGVYRAISGVFVVCRQAEKKSADATRRQQWLRAVCHARRSQSGWYYCHCAVAIRSHSSPEGKHDPAVGLYNHVLVRTIVASPSALLLNPRPRHLRDLCPPVSGSPARLPACRLSSRSQRLPESLLARPQATIPRPGPPCLYPYSLRFRISTPATAERSTFSSKRSKSSPRPRESFLFFIVSKAGIALTLPADWPLLAVIATSTLKPTALPCFVHNPELSSFSSPDLALFSH